MLFIHKAECKWALLLKFCMQQHCQKNLSFVKKWIIYLILDISSFYIYDLINFLLKYIVQFLECQEALIPYSDISFSWICEAKPVQSWLLWNT